MTAEEGYNAAVEEVAALLDAAPPAGLDEWAMTRALRAIHGDVVPLPNRCSPAEYAKVIKPWYDGVYEDA
jgi:hypothetical protein